MIVCAAYTQKSSVTDTICVPVSEVQASYRKADSLRILKVENDSTRALVILQQRRLASKDSSIIDLQTVIIKGKEQISLLHGNLDNLQHERDAEVLDKNTYHNLYIQQRRSKTWIIIGFVALLGGVIALK